MKTAAQIAASRRNLEVGRRKRRSMHAGVAEARHETRINVSHGVRDQRPTRQQGMTDEAWRNSYAAWTHPARESLDQYKNRVTAAALAKGMTRDAGGFFYAPGDRRQRTPLTPQGRPAGIQPARIERQRTERSGSDRLDAWVGAGMSLQAQKQRRTSTRAIELSGSRSVGTHTGQRRAVQTRIPSVPSGTRTNISGKHRRSA